MDSMMTETDDQISQYSTQPPTLEKFMHREKLDDLKCEVRELSREILHTGSKETTRVSLNPDQTVVLPERSVLLKKKTQIVNALRVELETDNSQDGPCINAQAFVGYTTQLGKDVQAIEQCLSSKTEEEERIKYRLERLEKTKKEMESFNKGLQGFLKDGLSDLERLEPLINQDFIKIKGIFNKYLKDISPSGNLQLILQELEQASNREGEDRYIEIDDENYASMMMLTKASLVVRHPRTAGKVRLCNFK
ncbi:unnamed protein product [Bemisia tabaci]|uniref:Uncharacterized protein n=1 Tax=Bemisia tabaci TaxID=7038 RepID=A0A9P0F8R2_BEMTA|nr:unnamed protein product [Bemisia tabaci]